MVQLPKKSTFRTFSPVLRSVKTASIGAGSTSIRCGHCGLLIGNDGWLPSGDTRFRVLSNKKSICVWIDPTISDALSEVSRIADIPVSVLKTHLMEEPLSIVPSPGLGPEEVSELEPERWLVVFPKTGASYELTSPPSFRALGAFTKNFRFVFSVENGRCRFEALKHDGKPWRGGDSEFLRFDTVEGDLTVDRAMAIIRKRMSQYYERIEWLFYPIGAIPFPKRRSRDDD